LRGSQIHALTRAYHQVGGTELRVAAAAARIVPRVPELTRLSWLISIPAWRQRSLNRQQHGTATAVQQPAMLAAGSRTAKAR